MADIARSSEGAARALAALIADHNGADVVMLDLAVQAGWTDFFVIATATSSAHLRGLDRFIDEGITALGLSRLNKRSYSEDDEWLLVDLGSVVVHVMTERARSFYELEKLWFQSAATRIEPGQGRAADSAQGRPSPIPL